MTGTDPLAAAHDHVTRLRAKAERRDDPDALRLDALEDVADMLRRVLAPAATPHYRVDKGQDLVAAAQKAYTLAVDAYTDCDPWEAARRSDAIHAAGRALTDATRAVTAAMWGLARGATSNSDIHELRFAARGLTRLADMLAEHAETEDPDD